MIKEEEFLKNLSKVKEEIQDSCDKNGRLASDVTLLPVTKNWPIEAVHYCKNNGIRRVGENRVQEAVSKMDVEQNVHFELIGHLQSNKANQVVGRFSSIQSVDSIKLLNRLSIMAEARGITQSILIQVNAGGDPAKYGVSIEDTESMLIHALSLSCLKVGGFMTIAPYDPDNKSVARTCFANLRRLRDQMVERIGIAFSELSMGMSGDLDAAIAEGSTMIRVGSALFGQR